VELVRGELVEMTPVGQEHGYVVLTLGSWMRSHVVDRKLGVVYTDVGFKLFRDPDTVRGPDIAFVSASRVGPGIPKDFFTGAPDLAVEVVSPWDKAGELQEKIREYLAAGARLVWLVDPKSRTVTAYHPSGAAQVYSGEQSVPGEDVLPEFSFRPADLFSF